MPSNSTAELALQLGRSMTEMRSHVSYFIEAKVKEYAPGISFEMLEIMACLWRKDGINQQEIADITVKDKSSITHLINQLAKRSLVSRVEDGRDRRNKLIYLTKTGRQLRKQLHPSVIQIYNQAGKGIRAEEIGICLKLVEKMNQNLRSKHLT
jgi:DNA-binding MarR family transcriptional regulator